MNLKPSEGKILKQALNSKEEFCLFLGEGRVWLNPPYSGWAPFLKKLKEHGMGTALVFVRTETRGFFEHVWDGASALLFLKGRIRFIRKGDKESFGGSTCGSVLIAYGLEDAEKLIQSDLNGKIILP